MYGLFQKKKPPQKPPKRFPPVPDWQPTIAQPLEQVIERFRHYTDQKCDFAVFANGTVVILPDGLSDTEAEGHAKDALHKVFHAHLDMYPLNMNDGNILVRYNHDVANVVLSRVVAENWQEIKDQHQRALATDEVLITPLGPNKFDESGMKALFGRCFMFMDAQAPHVIGVERSVA